MPKTIVCSRYQTELPGLEKQPVPGANGEKIFQSVSQRAWDEWQELQTMLINEKHLSLIDPHARKYLTEQMWRYFNNEAVDRAEGYIAPTGPDA
ncbi:MAG: oxidative damage protection protein [Pseudomonadales bacterium]|jgi:Fe-S cluster biosynthesis and repair protein YggX|nr:oxidative damage protection protein [Pseudomonadales bacterium]